MSTCNDLTTEHAAMDLWHMLNIEQNLAVFVSQIYHVTLPAAFFSEVQ